MIFFFFFFCSATENLMTEIEKYLKGTFLQKKMHDTFCGGGSFEITDDSWDAHYATTS